MENRKYNNIIFIEHNWMFYMLKKSATFAFFDHGIFQNSTQTHVEGVTYLSSNSMKQK